MRILLFILVCGLSLSAIAEESDLTVVVGSPVSIGKCAPIVGDYPIMAGSEECEKIPNVVYVPNQDRMTELRYWTIRVLQVDVDSGLLVSIYDRENATLLLGLLPMTRFYDRPILGNYTCSGGIPCRLCAAGIAAFDGPKVAVDRPVRVEQLIVWEWTNWFLTAIGRYDLWDSEFVGLTVGTVGMQITDGWKYE